MSGKRRSPQTIMTVLLMWLLPLCSVINSGLELLVIPGNAPKICKRWDPNGENNSVSAEKDVHHIPPASRHSRHHQVVSVVAIAPPNKAQAEPLKHGTDQRLLLPYAASFPQNAYTEIPVPPPELAG